jgi:hypothetical protein
VPEISDEYGLFTALMVPFCDNVRKRTGNESVLINLGCSCRYDFQSNDHRLIVFFSVKIPFAYFLNQLKFILGTFSESSHSQEMKHNDVFGNTDEPIVETINQGKWFFKEENKYYREYHYGVLIKFIKQEMMNLQLLNRRTNILAQN